MSCSKTCCNTGGLIGFGPAAMRALHKGDRDNYDGGPGA